MSIEKDFLLTPQRQVILEVLTRLNTHPTADEIFEEVRKQLPRISLGTVYRNLDMMSENGLINKLESSSPAKRFDAITNQHYHLRCLQCGKIEDAPIPADTTIEEAIKKLTEYEITGHNLEFTGICPTCKEKNNKH